MCISIGVFIVSCNKEDVSPGIQELGSTNEISWKVSADSLESELDAIFSEDFKYWQETGVSENAYLTIELGDGYAHFNLLDFHTSTYEKKIVCKGTGMSFGKCVKKWLDNNKGCLKIWLEDDIYFADDNC